MVVYPDNTPVSQGYPHRTESAKFRPNEERLRHRLLGAPLESRKGRKHADVRSKIVSREQGAKSFAETHPQIQKSIGSRQGGIDTITNRIRIEFKRQLPGFRKSGGKPCLIIGESGSE